MLSTAQYQQWQHWWIGNISQKFLTEEEAASYMRSAGHASNQYRTIAGPITAMSQNEVRRRWAAPDEPPVYTNDWIYRSLGSGTPYTSEAAVVQAIHDDLYDPTWPCNPMTQFDVDADWCRKCRAPTFKSLDLSDEEGINHD
jgi:hypothetical protein